MSIKLKDQNNNEIFIAGTNSEDFINDKVLRNDKTWSSNKIVEELYPTFQKEGNPIICYPVENYPLNVKATFSPKQAGSGDPSPENVRPITGWDEVTVTRCGKNLLDISLPHSFSTDDSTKFSLDLDLTGTFAFSAQIDFTEPGITSIALFSFVVDGTEQYISSGNINGGKILTGHLSKLSLINWSNSEGTINEIQLEVGSTPTLYEPYQGNDYTLTLPETIYGGTVDAVTGAGSKTWGYIASYNGESLPGEWISDRDVYSAGATPTTGAQVAYKLATPEPFQATGNQPLPAVAGLNTVYTDGDSLIISGKEDIKYTINQITSNIQNINQIQEINNILLGVE